jgi:hypothetical protein
LSFQWKKNDFCLKMTLLYRSSMSANKQIIETIKTFLDKNEKYTKKEFIDMCTAAFNECKKEKKTIVKKEKIVLPPIVKNETPTGYQRFINEYMPVLKELENEKDEEKRKKRTYELMKEIGGLWQEENK